MNIKKALRHVIILAAPILVRNLIATGVGFADGLMVASLGDSSTNGVQTANILTNFINTMYINLAAAITAISVQFWGCGRTERIRRTVTVGLLFSFAVSIPAFIMSLLFPELTLGLFTTNLAAIKSGVGYLRIVSFTYILYGMTSVLVSAMNSIEKVKVGMCISGCASLINVILNYCLIYGIRLSPGFSLPSAGVRGAALATLTSRFLEFLAIGFYVLKKDTVLRYSINDVFHADAESIETFRKYGIPIVAGGLVWAVNVSAQGVIIGRLGISEAISAYSVTGNLFNIVTVLVFSISESANIIIGKDAGAGNTEKIKLQTAVFQALFFAVGLLTGYCINLSRRMVPLLYAGLSISAISMCDKFLRILSITSIGTAYQACSLSLLKAGGDTRFVFLNDTFWVLAVVLPSAYIAGYLLDARPEVVFALLKGDQIYKCVVAAIKVNRFDWIHDISKQTRLT